MATYARAETCLTSSSPRGKITTQTSLPLARSLRLPHSVPDSQRRFVTEFPLESLINTFALATIASARVVLCSHERGMRWNGFRAQYERDIIAAARVDFGWSPRRTSTYPDTL